MNKIKETKNSNEFAGKERERRLRKRTNLKEARITNRLKDEEDNALMRKAAGGHMGPIPPTREETT